ncbi:MAG TPA: thioredoxin [Chitinivibrionales bacterium]|nr:thioredoxin [Chitinivibrionales bacterium]
MHKETSDLTFENDVLKSGVPVLVDFWAPWCGPCKIAEPILEQIAQKTSGKAQVFKMNVDENSLIPGRYGITAIPTVIVFRNGRIEREFVGVQPENVYLGALALT